jgi:hypothetical protein
VLEPAEPLVADHRVGGRPILAGAASVEFVVAAAQRRGYELPIRLSRIRWLRPLVVNRPLSLDVTLTKVSTGYTYKIGVGSETHGTGSVEETLRDPSPKRVNLNAVLGRCPRPQNLTELYDAFDAAGLRYGPTFRLLRAAAVGQGEAVATLATPDDSGPTVPAPLLDAAFQAVATLVDLDDPTPLLPVGVRSLDVYAPLDTATHAVVRRRSAHLYDIDITDGAGLLLLRVQGLALRPADRLEVVLRHVVGDAPAEKLRLHVGRAVVEARPDASFDDLRERLREAVEVARRGTSRIKGPARHVEADLVGTEEHPQHAQVRPVVAEMS